jgi:hypothetical protein
LKDKWSLVEESSGETSGNHLEESKDEEVGLRVVKASKACPHFETLPSF